jgi:sialic acid synthase
MIIAEIGCNHQGSLEHAKQLIRAAKSCGAHVAKFQKRTPRELLSPADFGAAHPVPENSFGESYGAHREYLEFSLDQHRQLMDACEEEGIVYSTSVWDVTSAREIVSLKPQFIKVGSPSNLHFDMQGVLRDEYEGGVHISLGMTTMEEVEKIMSFWDGHLHRVVLYSCTSGYPVPHEQVCLKDIARLRQVYGERVKAIGFSGHHLGIALDMAAIALGAEWVERHFTLDRTLKGTDHAASLEVSGMQRLVRDALAVKMALRERPSALLEVEVATRKKLKFLSDGEGT